MTVEQALARLETLGSADAIAVRLTDLRCTGGAGRGDGCPVARFVSAESGEPTVVGRLTYMLVGRPEQPIGMLSQHVRDFVGAFDEGDYPELRGDAGGSAYESSPSGVP